jgi:hypothetical protein
VVGDFVLADLKEDRKYATFCSELEKNVSERDEILSRQISVTMPWEEHKPVSDFLNPDVGSFRLHTVNIHVFPSHVVTSETSRKTD